MTASIWNPETPVLSADVLAAFANTVNPTQGAGLVGANLDLAYAANTLGWAARIANSDSNPLRWLPPSEWAAVIAGTSNFDCTAALQSAINYASNNSAPQVFIPAGIWKYTRLYNYYDVSLNPGYNPNINKMGRVRILGAGKIDAREANNWPTLGFAGTVLLSTVTAGTCFNLSPASADGGAYPARECAFENITLVGNTTGFVVQHWCAIESKLRNVTVLQLNAAGGGVFWKNAWFTHWDSVYVVNRQTTGQTGAGVDFGASLFAGSFRFSNCYFENFQDDFVINESAQSVAFIFDGVCTFQGAARDGLQINAAIRSLVIDTPYFEFNGRSHIRCTLSVGAVHSLAIRGGFMLGGTNLASSMTGAMIHIRNVTSWSVDGLAVFRPWTDIVDVQWFAANGTLGAIKNTTVDSSDNTPGSAIYLARVNDQRAVPVLEANNLIGSVQVQELDAATYLTNSKQGFLGLETFALSGRIQRRSVALNETVFLQAATASYMQVLAVAAGGSIIAMPGLPGDGRQIVIANRTSSASSTSVRQSDATTVISALAPGQALLCYYDTTAVKWIAVGPLVFSGL